MLSVALIWLAGLGYFYLEFMHEADELRRELMPRADSDELIEEITEAFTNTFFYPLLAGLPVLAASLFLVIYLSFRPLRDLRRRIDQLAPNELQPISTDPLPTEIRPVVIALNNLFERTSRAMAREKRLTADAAHELRTPIAVIQANAQALEKEVSGSPTLRELTQDLVSGCQRASRAIDQILELARLESQDTRAAKTKVNITELVRQEIAAQMVLIDQKRIQLTVHTPTEIQAELPEGLLTIAIRNLLGNAVRYTPAQGEIQITLLQERGAITFEISDSGPGLTHAQIQRLGERFYRADASEAGAGLGWSVIQRCIESLPARLETIGHGPLGGLCVRITF